MRPAGLPVNLAGRLRRRIADEGPLPVSAWVQACLYDPDGGFYMTGGSAGRRADFLTAPEVGPLFGAVLARALDVWWDEQGRPDPFVVIDWGAGPGTLARALLAASPLCAGALELHLVEVSPAQRAHHPEGVRQGPAPAHVIVANELLDNLPFDVAEWRGAWHEVRVDIGASGRFVTVVGGPVEVPGVDPEAAAGLEPGTRVPVQGAARRWVDEARDLLVPGGRLVVVDYGGGTVELGRRGGWLRTHRRHRGGSDWLDEPGSRDITSDVAFDQIQVDHPAGRVGTQAAFLARYGIDELVAEGRRVWSERAGIGDLAALRARSRVAEAEALCDPAGMGAFTVLEWWRAAVDGARGS